MNDLILSKIAQRWPHLKTMVDGYRVTRNLQQRNAIISSVLNGDVGFLTASEISELAKLRPGSGPAQPEPESAAAHIHIRTTMRRKSAYVRAAQKKGLPLADWITETCDAASGDLGGDLK